MVNHIVAYKSNWLIEASYKLSLQEQRFLLCCIGKLNPKLENKSMTITASEFSACFPKMTNVEREMYTAIDKLWDRSVIVKDPNQTNEFRWIQNKAKYHKGQAKCSIIFSDPIMPYLTQLHGHFTKVIIKNVSSLTSVYSIRLYEILQQRIDFKERILSIADIKDILGIDNKYKSYKSLNQWVIKPAVAELNMKSNLKVKVDPIKEGRTVKALHFIFKENQQLKN